MKLLTAAKFEIETLRREISSKKRDTVETQKNMRVAERKIYTYEQIELLKTDAQKRKARNLCECANVSSKYKIDEIIREVKRDAKQKQRL